jgi:hypothetical protein
MVKFHPKFAHNIPRDIRNCAELTHSPPCKEANTYLLSYHNIPYLFCNPNIYYSVHKRPSLHSAVHAGTAESSRLQKQRSTQSTAHSDSTIKCNPSVKITKKFSLKMTQQGRNM